MLSASPHGFAGFFLETIMNQIPCRAGSPSSAIRKKLGFTLVELLVVIGIIALLISILRPALNRAREQARLTKCLSNIRNSGMLMTMYADQFKGKLPMHQGGGSWLWDVTTNTRDALAGAATGPRDIMYCPSQVDRDRDDLWSYRPEYAVFGYFFLHKRHPNVPAGPPAGTWPGLPPTMVQKEYCDKVSMSHASERELITDAVLSQNGSYINVIGGFGKLPDSTNHYRASSGLPEGGNILFLDGHAEWRSFSEMKNRCSAGPTNFWF